MKKFTISALVLSLALTVCLATILQAQPTTTAKTSADASKKSRAKKPRKPKAKSKKDKPVTAKQKIKISKKVFASSVIAEYHIKYHKGELPDLLGDVSGDVESLISQQRPLEVPGFLIAKDRVLLSDPNIPARFIKSISVKAGNQKINATVERYFIFGDYAILKLDSPVKKAKPIKFNARLKGPYFAASIVRVDTRWTVVLSAVPNKVLFSQGQDPMQMLPQGQLIVNRTGKPVGFPIQHIMPLDRKWKGRPDKVSQTISAADWEKLQQTASQTVRENVYRATLQFRSPKKQQERMSYGDENETEMQTLAIKAPVGNQVVILANLKPARTALLEKITLHINGKHKAKKINATFVGTFKDYGAFIAKAQKQLPGNQLIWKTPDNGIQKMDQLKPGAEIRLRGNQLEFYYHRLRIVGFRLGWKNHIYPRVASLGNWTLVFSHDGKSLLTIPVARRNNVDQQRYFSRHTAATPNSAGDIAKLFPELAANLDKSNVPLGEQEEKRLAWLGLILQPMSPELARINKISDQTNGGSTGGMVSYVYPNSPAAKAGIKTGDFIIRLHIDGKNEPIDLNINDPINFAVYFWNRFDEISDVYFDRLPTPWIPIENNFTRMLTDLGLGKKFTADFIIDGKLVKKNFTVEQSPTHYGTAESYKLKPLGCTVKNITFELRRYFQMKPGQKGVIISKIKQGSKASIAGLKPFEIITDINNKPVYNVKDFERMVSAGGELNFSVKRWIKGRMVKVEVKKQAPKPAAKK